MIELTPSEVEACRRLKVFTERHLSEELYQTIEKDAEFMRHTRQMCRNALAIVDDIFKMLLKNPKAQEAPAITKDDINKTLIAEAGPLSIFYVLGRAQPNKRKKEGTFTDIDGKRKENIRGYRNRIKELEDEQAKGNEGFNSLLASVRKAAKNKGNVPADIDKHKFKAGGSDSEETKKAKEAYNAAIDGIKGKKAEERHAETVKNAYFAAKKQLDRAINEQRHKIEWQLDHAESLERRAITENCKSLTLDDMTDLISKIDGFSPSDCSDVFRLLGTVIEQIPALLKEKKKDYGIFGVKAEDIKLWVALRSSYRETSGIKLEDTPLYDDERYSIDQGEKFVIYCDACNAVRGEDKVMISESNRYRCFKCGNTKYIGQSKLLSEREDWGNEPCDFGGCDGTMVLSEHNARRTCSVCGAEVTYKVEQELECTKCKHKATMYFPPPDRVIEKPISCPSCKEESFMPAGIRPFWAGKDGFRARRRDYWSAGAILSLNSVTRIIDRLFGLPEAADISGTTADQIYGTELIMNLSFYGDNVIGTRGDLIELNEAEKQRRKERWRAKSGQYSGLLILLPLITMSKHGHHSILECALTFALTGYIDAYHVGYYTTLLPKGTSPSSNIGKVLKKWEDSPTNVRMIIELTGDGEVDKGWLCEPEEIESRAEYSLYDTCTLNYPRYVDVFKPLRDRQNKKTFITKTSLMIYLGDSIIRRGLKALDMKIKKLRSI